MPLVLSGLISICCARPIPAAYRTTRTDNRVEGFRVCTVGWWLVDQGRRRNDQGCRRTRQNRVPIPDETAFVRLRVLAIRVLVETVLHIPRFVVFWMK